MMTIKKTDDLILLTMIERPVLIHVIDNLNKELYKVRILYPDGKCVYLYKPFESTGWNDNFRISCFRKRNLVNTVRGMFEYDFGDELIYKVVEL